MAGGTRRSRRPAAAGAHRAPGRRVIVTVSLLAVLVAAVLVAWLTISDWYRPWMPSTVGRLGYPLHYVADIRAAAQRNNLDPALVAAVIYVESHFDQSVQSRSGAVGLMQVMPDSGRELARKIPVRGFRLSKLTSPEINIRLGTYYFRRLLDSCDGKVEDALAAYNAGRSRVTLWRGWGPFEDINEFAETIPFAQTRDYVQIILRNAELYRWLYASEPVAPADEAAAPKIPLKAAASASRKPAPVAVETSETSEKPAKSAASASRRSSKTVAGNSEPSDEKPAKSAASVSKKPSKGASASSRKSSKPSEPKTPKAKKKHPKHRPPESS